MAFKTPGERLRAAIKRDRACDPCAVVFPAFENETCPLCRTQFEAEPEPRLGRTDEVSGAGRGKHYEYHSSPSPGELEGLLWQHPDELQEEYSQDGTGKSAEAGPTRWTLGLVTDFVSKFFAADRVVSGFIGQPVHGGGKQM